MGFHGFLWAFMGIYSSFMGQSTSFVGKISFPSPRERWLGLGN